MVDSVVKQDEPEPDSKVCTAAKVEESYTALPLLVKEQRLAEWRGQTIF